MAKRFKNCITRIIRRLGAFTCTRSQAGGPVTIEVLEPRPISAPTTEIATKAAPTPDTIIIPDLVSRCNFNIHCNSKAEAAVEGSKAWLFKHDQLGEKRKNAFQGLKAGGGMLGFLVGPLSLADQLFLEFTSMRYPYAEFDQLEVCCDFMNYSFHLDDLSNGMTHLSTHELQTML